jgi:hypothetical protein
VAFAVVGSLALTSCGGGSDQVATTLTTQTDHKTATNRKTASKPATHWSSTIKDPSELRSCSSLAMGRALPKGAVIMRAACRRADGTMVAGGVMRVDKNEQTFFLRQTSTGWRREDTERMCANGGRNLPENLDRFCDAAKAKKAGWS